RGIRACRADHLRNLQPAPAHAQRAIRFSAERRRDKSPRAARHRSGYTPVKFLNRTARQLRGLNQGVGCAIGLVHMTYSRPITISDFAAIRACIRRPMIQNRIAVFGLALSFVLIDSSRLMALDVPVLNASRTDWPHMMPQVSV